MISVRLAATRPRKEPDWPDVKRVMSESRLSGIETT